MCGLGADAVALNVKRSLGVLDGFVRQAAVEAGKGTPTIAVNVLVFYRQTTELVVKLTRQKVSNRSWLLP
jgi:hypothetical protein